MTVCDFNYFLSFSFVIMCFAMQIHSRNVKEYRLQYIIEVRLATCHYYLSNYICLDKGGLKTQM